MAIYLYWGEDDFLRQKAVEQLRDSTLDPQWSSFNYDKIPPDQPNAVMQGLNQAMTPPFGMGNRLVWLSDTTLCQRCSDTLLQELERTLPRIPETTVLLLTSPSKPDGRLKSTKLLKKHGEIQEFSPIPPWKTDQLLRQVQKVAQDLNINLSPDAAELLAESVGNDVRQLYSALEKLSLYESDRPSSQRQIQAEDVGHLVRMSTQNSLQLAAAIREGDIVVALDLVQALMQQNEPALKILATLVGQFRTWLWIKLMLASGESDYAAIAKAAGIRNPKRLYFLQKEISSLTVEQLSQTLPLLLQLELNLKQGANPTPSLQTTTIQLCHLFARP